jgi:5'-nucleotidase (lipoprotein e(P4) family)
MIKQRFQILLAVSLMVTAAVGCACKDATSIQRPQPNSRDGHIPDRLNSILWVQSSTEYQMVATQSYLLAEALLDRGLEDNDWTAAVEQSEDYSQLPPAIIVDVDETVLDNSAYHARLECAGTYWDDDLWDDWVLEMHASAVPGSVEFLRYAQSRGVIVFYVTNRSHEHEQATRSNLLSLGFPISDQVDTLLTRRERTNWDSDKTTRRSFIAEQYRIILLIGDDANDFVAGTQNVSSELREEVLDKYEEYWGEKWVVIPNPVYGGWESALYDFKSGLSDAQKFEIKFEGMDTLE